MTAKLDGTNGLLQQYDFQTPTTGFSYTFAAGVNVLVMNPAGTLATGTITMPASPVDGMTITFSSTKTITALTVNANTGQSIVGAPTVLPANQAGAYVYRLSNTTWYPYETVPTNVPVVPAGGSIITSGTSQATTSGTVINFTGIPSWVKRITLMLNAVSTSGTSNYQVRIGTSSGIESTGYLAQSSYVSGGVGTITDTTSFPMYQQQATGTQSGSMTICSFGSNIWIASGYFGGTNGTGFSSTGTKTLSGTLDRLQFTSVTPDTFDAGSINILYE